MPKKILTNWKGFDVWQNMQSQEEAADLIPGGNFASTLSFVEGAANVYDKDGKLLQQNELQEYIAIQQQKKRDGENVSNDVFYFQDLEDETEMYAVTVTYGDLNPRLSLNEEPLSEVDRKAVLEPPQEAKKEPEAALEQPQVEQQQVEQPAEKEPEETAVDRFFAAWQEVENFKKSAGMENRGMDIMSTNKLNRALKTVQEITFVSDKDGNPMTGDMWTSLLTAKQSTYEKGEKVPTETFYLRCKDDISKMFKLSVDFGKTKPTFKLDKTPLPDKERLELTGKWEAEKTAHEAFKEAGLDLDDLRMRRELIASAPQRLLNAFKGVQEMKKVPDFKRPGKDMALMELGKNLENVQGVATVCDAAGNKLEGNGWLEHITAKQLLRSAGQKAPKDTFYLTCKEDNSKMFKVTVEYGKTKPKFKIDKTPVAEDDRWKLRGEWQKNAAAAQKAAAQLDVKDPSAEDSPEKQNQKEKTAGAAKNVAKGAAVEKNAEKVAKNATETVITPSLDERRKAAGKDAHGYDEPSWKKYDVNAKKAGSGVVMEMQDLSDLVEPQKQEKIVQPTVEQRDLERINLNLNKMKKPELAKEDKLNPEFEKQIVQNFRLDAVDAAKENDSVRTLLANMEASTMQALYAAYRDDLQKGVDPKLKGVLNETVQLADVEKNAANAVNKEAEYFPIPNNEDLENEQLQQQKEENKALEEIQVKQMP